ncbi:hypothetical protein [Rubinisphaera italica]|uniref:Uncharacterized protein n=1 Tax=Rubinisphaera italica TaxID=2527969 RepID=A0A5C5X9M9_9PLAN|nr:hypothetical protein [Rubinisphaera italica]TWT59409.1 hypothetical protein Pan54_01150 [Rubinisphaera italica]
MTEIPQHPKALEDQPVYPTRGRWLIAVMFLFAISVSVGLWTYWELHTRPFRSLTDALGEKFPDSNPRVEGGKHGLHRDIDSILRIVIRIEYNPEREPERYENDVLTILQMAANHVELQAYDRCDIHLFRQTPEEEPVVTSRTISREDFPQPQI